MKIRSVRIQNFRGFLDETVQFNLYTCLVGTNGAGKSSVLAALNLFFRNSSTPGIDLTRLSPEDYHRGRTDEPIRITVTFDTLSEVAQDELKDYVRQGQLCVTAVGQFDAAQGLGVVKHHGQRRGMEEFRRFFEMQKSGATAVELGAEYEQLKSSFPDLPNVRSRDDKAAALREYETSHPEDCVLIESEDNFYGISGTGRLAPFVQWVYVPAVKDAHEEGQEGRNTALGKLVARAVRGRTTFDRDIEELKAKTLASYLELVERNQGCLAELSNSLRQRLADWSHPNARLDMRWSCDPGRSVVVTQPVAEIKAGDGDFLASLSRMGHGLQRSYLLALLSELASSDQPDSPTLILGCEEPELYQHPPQARHLADVMNSLSMQNNQVVLTTHSPFFVSGEGVLVYRPAASTSTGSVCVRARLSSGSRSSAC